MLRTKYRSKLGGNLKQEKERKIARYLEKFFLAQALPYRNRITGRQDTEKGAKVAIENATIVTASQKSQVDAKFEEKGNKLGAAEYNLSAGLDHPTTSNNQSERSKIDRNRAQNKQHKAIQMRQNLSAERLQGNDELDDASSTTEEPQRRSKYILVGWDSFRSRTMVVLLVLLIVWASIYFPLIGT